MDLAGGDALKLGIFCGFSTPRGVAVYIYAAARSPSARCGAIFQMPLDKCQTCSIISLPTAKQ